jgi:hypothetical protein
MKNAPTTISNESAPDKRDYTCGTMPKRINTVTAEVLSKMLESNRLTGMESVFNQNTTRLAAFVDYLQKHYGWNIERKEMVVDTKDGRTPSITIYWLSQDSITAAFEVEARAWIDSVKLARADRRKQANKKKMSAAQKSAARCQLRKQDPRQGGLWGDQ